MDTIYYHLNVRKVKVSGGADLLTLLPTPAPGPAPAGEVLDFERCRRRLETRRAWTGLVETAQQPLDSETAEPCPVPERGQSRERAAAWLEMAASGAVILVSLAAAISFFCLI